MEEAEKNKRKGGRPKKGITQQKTQIISIRFSELEYYKKLEVIQANTKTKDIQPINQDMIPVVSKGEIDEIVHLHTSHLGKFIEKTHKLEVEKLNLLITNTNEIKKQIAALPKPECKFQQQPPVEISFDPIIKLFPKPKKITIAGFEFLRSSMIIFALSLAVFWLFVLNIKQMDDYRALKSQYSQQNEYILQMQSTEKVIDKKAK
jgi:hypothetical protein